MKRSSGVPSSKPLLDKLGVKPGCSVGIVEISDEKFLRQLRRRAGSFTESRPREDSSDLIFFQAQSAQDLERLPSLRGSIRKDGAIWVVFPKGIERIRACDVRTAAEAAGLVDIKVVGFSRTHTALKLVIPVARR